MTLTGPTFDAARHLRVSVMLAGEEFDLEVPADEPMREWLPDLVEILHEHGILSGSQRAERWFRAGGVPLTTDIGLSAQGVVPGQYLWVGTPPEPRVRLLPDGYSLAKRPMTVQQWSRRTVSLRGRGAIVVALALALQGGTLATGPTAGLIAISAVVLLLQLGMFFALALSARLAELASSRDWEVYAGATFVGTSLVGFQLGTVSDQPGFVIAAALSGTVALAALIVGVSRRWLPTFVVTASAIIVLFAVLNESGVLQRHQAIAAAMAVAVVLAAASHRVSLLLARPRRRERQDDPTTSRRGVAAALEHYVTRPERIVSRARFAQSAIATAALAVVALAAVVNGRSPIETWYELACLLALACFAFTAAYRSRTIVIAVTLGLAATVVVTSDLPAPILAGACAAVAVVTIAFALDALIGPTDHPTISAVLIRARLLLIIAVFALLAAELDGWQLAWGAGTALGSKVFS